VSGLIFGHTSSRKLLAVLVDDSGKLIISMTNHTILDGSYHTDTVLSTPVRGGIIRVNSTPKYEQLALGNANEILSSDGSDVKYQTLIALIKAALLTANGDIIYRDTDGTVKRLPIGAESNVLTSSSGVPTWAAPASSGACTLIQEITADGTATTIDFQNIASTYRNLQIVYQARSSKAGSQTEALNIRFNNDSGNNYNSYQRIQYFNNQYSQIEIIASSAMDIGDIPAATATASEAGSGVISIPNYKGTTFLKTLNAHDGLLQSAASGNIKFCNAFGYWNNAAAITRVTLRLASGNFVSGSVASLYGLS
jgi:hypothetical protein